MSVEEARKLHELIAEDEELQAKFKGLETRSEVIEQALKIAHAADLQLTSEDMENVLDTPEQEAEGVDDNELEKVAGGDSSRWRICLRYPVESAKRRG